MLEDLVSRRHISSSKVFDLEKEPHGRATSCPQISLVSRGLHPCKAVGVLQERHQALPPGVCIAVGKKNFKGLY